MVEKLKTTEKRVLAQILVLGDVHERTIYNTSEMLTESQRRAIESLDDRGILEQTLYEGEH